MRSRKKIVLSITISIVLIAGAAISLLSFYKERPASSETIVRMTAKGYVPSEIVIRTGETVTFVNDTADVDFWPASDPHPVHTGYAAFDSMGPVPPGESWSFTFDKPGVWPMHDHFAPYFVGKVTVLDGYAEVSNNLASCGPDSDTKACWEESLLSIMNKRGLSASFDEIARLYGEKPEFPAQCHNIMHNIGHRAYSAYLKDEDSIIDPKVSYCAYGFYHGFMESFLNANPDIAAAHDICSFIDESLKGKSPDASLQCYHGIGHGLIAAGFQSGRQVKGEQDIVAPALEYCRQASDTAEQLYRCASGVFNGIANFYITGEYGLKADPEDPLAICRIQGDEFKEACYGNLNSTIFWLAGDDFAKAARFVVDMEDREYADMSMRYLSGLASLGLAAVDPAKAIEACRPLGDLKDSCIRGFAHGLLEHGQPGAEYEQAMAFCEHSALTQGEAAVCASYTITNLDGWYPRDKVAEICSSVKPEYEKYCDDEEVQK